MAITLGALTLPHTLVWEDEFHWSPIAQTPLTDEYRGLTGAQIIHESERQGGQPITLIGQSNGNSHTGGILRSDLQTLYTLLHATSVSLTLTLHDARTFTVTGRHDGDRGPIDAVPLPAFGSIYPANPANTHWYLLRALRLRTV